MVDGPNNHVRPSQGETVRSWTVCDQLLLVMEYDLCWTYASHVLIIGSSPVSPSTILKNSLTSGSLSR